MEQDTRDRNSQRVQQGAMGRRIRSCGDCGTDDLGEGSEERDRCDYALGSADLRCRISNVPIEKRNADLERRNLPGDWGDRRRACWSVYHGKAQVRKESESRSRDLGDRVGDMDTR